MAEEGLLEDLHDAVVRLHSDVDDLEKRFCTVCGAYGFSAMRAIKDKEELLEQIKVLRKQQHLLQKCMREFSKRIQEMNMRIEHLNCYGWASSNRPSQRRRRIVRALWEDLQPWDSPEIDGNLSDLNPEVPGQLRRMPDGRAHFNWNPQAREFVPPRVHEQ